MKPIKRKSRRNIYQELQTIFSNKLPTEDNWNSSFEIDGKLYVRIHAYKFTGKYYICLKGDDDYNLLKEFNSKEEMAEELNQIKTIKNVTKEYIESLGFEYYF